jgi:hypothetical protein
MTSFDNEDFMCNYVYLKRFVKISDSVVSFRDTHGEVFKLFEMPLMTNKELLEFMTCLYNFDKAVQRLTSTITFLTQFREGFYEFQERVVMEWYDHLRILDDYFPYSNHFFLFLFLMILFFDAKFRLMDITPEETAPKEIAELIAKLTRWELEYYRELPHQTTLAKMGKLSVTTSIQRLRGRVSNCHVVTCLKMFNGQTNQFCNWWESMQEKMYEMIRNYEILLRNEL